MGKLKKSSIEPDPESGRTELTNNEHEMENASSPAPSSPEPNEVLLPSEIVQKFRKVSHTRAVLSKKKSQAIMNLNSEQPLPKIGEKPAEAAGSLWSKLNPRKRMSTRKMSSGIHERDPTGVADAAVFHEKLNKDISGIDEHAEEHTSDDDIALVKYFAKLAKSTSVLEEIDVEFIENLLKQGCDINSTDQYGQTILHEAARAWHKDVVKFLLHHGASINQEDMYGRTPLHVAAAVNYGEMVEYLIKRGADIHSLTYEERQQPIHYAAKFDALASLQVLIAKGANVETRDYKDRTPLQVAAELDRSTTTKFLIEQGALVGVCDSSGLPALTLIIEKMPPVAKEALDKLHIADAVNREQEFHLNLIEPPTSATDSEARSPMAELVNKNHINLLLLPIMQQLVVVKWNRFGRRRHFLELALYFFYIIMWSIIGFLLPDHDEAHSPNTVSPTVTFSSGSTAKPSTFSSGAITHPETLTFSGYRIWWMLLLEAICLLITIYYIVAEILEAYGTFKSGRQYKEWRTTELKRDLVYTHPRWPDEREYINREIQSINDASQEYLTDLWNVFDWVCYVLSIATYISRAYTIDSMHEPDFYHRRLFSITLIFIWLRLMKLVRVFESLGPFIVMIGQIVDDTIKFAFLFFEVFIPFVFAFWILFGGRQNAEIMRSLNQDPLDWEEFHNLMYTVWAMVYGGDYNYAAIHAMSDVTAQICTGVYVALSSILLLNLFIALMSNSFQTVYDNAKGNALMQKASVLISYEEAMGKKKNAEFIKYIQQECAPIVEYYDEDDNAAEAQLEKMTIQIKGVVDEIQESINWHFKKNPGRQKSNSMADPGKQNDILEQVEELSNTCQQNCDKLSKEMTATSNDMNERMDHLTNLVQKLVDAQRPNSPPAPPDSQQWE